LTTIKPFPFPQQGQSKPKLFTGELFNISRIYLN